MEPERHHPTVLTQTEVQALTRCRRGPLDLRLRLVAAALLFRMTLFRRRRKAAIRSASSRHPPRNPWTSRVLDSTGRILRQSGTRTNQELINLAGLFAGEYYIQVVERSGCTNPRVPPVARRERKAQGA